MTSALRRAIDRRRLKDPEFAFLFEPPPDDAVVSLDCETTGLDRKRDELLSIAAIRIDGTRIRTSERLDLLVRPEGHLHPDNVAFHWLRPIDVAEGLPVDEALDRLLHFIGSRPLVGYYLEFDVAIINRYLRSRLGIRLPNPVIEVSGLYYDLTLPTTRDGYVDLSFEGMRRGLGLPQRPRHTAFGDALLGAMMYVKLAGMPKPKRRWW